MKTRSLSVTVLVALMSTVAPLLFAAGNADAPRATEGTAATATTAAADMVLVAGRYTWPQNWLETPTASQLGITAFNEAPMLAEMVAGGELPPVEDRLGADRWALQAELLPAIGTVAYVVRPIIVNNRVRNVPEVLPFAFESMLWIQATPVQFYIAE